MNKNKNTAIIISLLSAVVVFVENYFNIFDAMANLDEYTLFVLLRSIAVLGIVYVAYLCFAQNEKRWFWTMGITALWINASLSSGSVSLIISLLNLATLAVLVMAIFKLKFSRNTKNN